jgi:hypothetical protein
VSHGYEGLCTLVPVADGRESPLREHLHSLPVGARSPMTRVPGTHFARWTVLRLEGTDGRPHPGLPPLLLFSAEFDGPLEEYARRLCRRLGADAHAIWSHCAGYPGDDPAELAAWLLRHRVRPGYSVVAYPDTTVEQVRAAIGLRERLGDFLIRAERLEPEALQRAWLQRFRARDR